MGQLNLRAQLIAGNAGALARIEREARTRFFSKRPNDVTVCARFARCAGEGARVPSNNGPASFIEADPLKKVLSY